jgi:hypothetical protein
MTTERQPFSSGLGEEPGLELEDAEPLRISGFLCLLFGVLSIFCTVGQPLLFLPLVAFVLGGFALRPSGDQMPVGTRPAMLGLVLAAGFGACGLFLPLMKSRTLGKQAEQFSRDYMEVLARGHEEIALELQKDYVNRLSTEMSLVELYASNEVAREALEGLRDSSSSAALRQRGPGADWVLAQPTRVYYAYGSQHAEVVWEDPTGEVDIKIQIFLDYLVDREGNGQWNVQLSQPYRKRIVAETVL